MLRKLIVLGTLSAAVIAVGCESPQESCASARADAAAEWRLYAEELRAAPQIPERRVSAKMEADHERYDRECRRHYGIASGVDAEMSDGQATALIACKITLPAVDLGASPDPSVATGFARAATTLPSGEYGALVADFRWMWDRGGRPRMSHADFYEASEELIAACRSTGGR